MKSNTLTSACVSLRVSRYIVPAMILLHPSITITLAKIQNLWVDEAFSLHTTQYGIGHAFSRALSFEEQPPAYFVLLNLWRNIHGSYFWARLFSVLCIFLTLLVFATMSKKLLKDIHPGWLTAVVAFNPFIIWAATEIRVYALVILISTLLCKFFWDAYLSENPVGSAKWYYGLLSVFALYTFYFLGFLLIANVCALLILKRWRLLRAYLFTMIVVALCLVPMSLVVFNQISHSTEAVERSLTIWDGLTWVGSTILWYIIPFEGDFFRLVRKLSIFIGIVVVSIYIWKKRSIVVPHIVVPQNIAYLTIVSTLYIFNVAVLIFLGHFGFIEWKHTLYLFPPLLFCVFLVLVAVVEKKGVIIYLLIPMFLSVGGTIVKFAPATKPGDWARVASYLMDFEKPRQPILVYRSEAALPLAFHYSGINNIAPIPRKMNLKIYDLVYDNILKDEIEISQFLSGVLNDCQNFWLVTDSFTSYRGVKFSHKLLMGFINKEYTIVTTKNFYGSQVRLVQNNKP